MSIQSYIRPSSTETLPGELTLNQFLHSILVGLTALHGTLVRPKWQVAPPKNPPGIETDWLAFGVDISRPDANSYVWNDPADSSGETSESQRHELLDIGCSLYGPLALQYYGIIRDGFQIPQNTQALTEAKMAFVEILPARSLPDLVHDRFYNRVETSIILRREVNRTYSVPSIISSTGVIHAPLSGDEDYSLDWDTENEEN